jgi:Holliday junction DNA helicase RuvA
MIARLRGRLVALDVDGVIVDVGGVGYRVLVPAGAFPQRLGDDVVVHTHLAVREDAMTLFGFPDVTALRLFERLLGVNGIGPKLALSALATLGATGVRDAILAEDTRTLVTVPGLGRKTAQRLILELGGNLASEEQTTGATAAVPVDDPRAEVRMALAALGYETSEITRALQAIGEEGGADAEVMLRQALRTLAGAS